MYHLTEGLTQDWHRLLELLVAELRRRGWTEAMEIDPKVDDLASFLAAPDLLFGQTCGYPLVTSLADRVQVLGTPAFNLPYCEGMRYCSLLVVRESGPLFALEDLRGKCAVYNGLDSQSGMNTLRHSVAPLARAGRFFGEVRASGGHRESLAALQAGAADVAAIDCVHFGFALRDVPERLNGLRVLHVSAHAPGLPFIASKKLSPSRLQDLKDALYAIPAAHPDLMARLAIRTIEPTTPADYEVILDMEQEAVGWNYPVLA